jgi:ADP-ribose pyrophosphatase YjhB (NUDIX family)
MTRTWLSPDEWKRAQETLPICCVDVLPLRLDEAGERVDSLGLIQRRAPGITLGWCLVGGRVLLEEPFGDAVQRHLLDTLGPDVRVEIGDAEQPLYVAQYKPMPAEGFLVDPRQHSIALT